MYVVEYLITIKVFHCTLKKLKLTFVLRATLPHFAGTGDWKGFVGFFKLKFLFFSPFWGDFWQELFRNVCNSFVIWQTKGENWDQTDLKMVFRGQ